MMGLLLYWSTVYPDPTTLAFVTAIAATSLHASGPCRIFYMADPVELEALTRYDSLLRSKVPLTSSLERTLWQQVQVVDDDESCWPWTGSQYKERNGEKTYGRFAIPAAEAPDGRRKITTAPRAVFWFACGYWSMTTRHTCDNPPCCRPIHLLDGTQADNNRDRKERGRTRNRPFPRGEANPVADLTEDMVVASRILYRSQMSFLRIAAILGRSEPSVRQAAYGETWGHIEVPPPIAPEERRSPGGKLTPEQQDEVRRLRAAGHRPRDIAWQFGVEPSNVSYLTRDMRNPRPSTRRGEKFTDEQIREMRRLREVEKLELAEIGSRFDGITISTVSKICRRQIYAHVS